MDRWTRAERVTRPRNSRAWLDATIRERVAKYEGGLRSESA